MNQSNTSSLCRLSATFTLRRSKSRTVSRVRRRAYGLLALLFGAVAGCSDQQLDAAVRKVLEPRRTPQQYMLVAVADADADKRRSAVARIADSREAEADWAVKGFIAIALLENDTQARLVAIRALARTADPRGVETLLKLLNHADFPPEQVRPPDSLCRWDALDGLAQAAERGAAAAPLHAALRSVFLRHLAEDEDWHARVAAARGLAALPGTPDALDALIGGLRDERFAVVYACEAALVKLTGHTHDANIAAWEAWREQNKAAPFENAGRIPDARRPPYDTRWEKFTYETKQALRWAFPGDKSN